MFQTNNRTRCTSKGIGLFPRLNVVEKRMALPSNIPAQPMTVPRGFAFSKQVSQATAFQCLNT